MPIETQCPHCQKAFRLKDEFLGKKVKCPNPACQTPFVVTALTEKAPKPKPAAAPKKSAADVAREAEELAATMFGEAAAPVAEDTRTVDMACASCDHKWTVPFDKRGKFVVCPDCGFRQKVPDKKVEKKIDWRDPNANRPSMAKGEEIPEDLREQMTRNVGGEALVEAGVIVEDVESVPLTVKLQRIAVVLGVVAVVAFGVLYVFQSRREGKEQRFMDDALAEVEKVADDGFAKGEPPLLKAVLMTAAAEHALRNDLPDQRKLAQDRFGIARQLIETQPRSAEREALLGELAVLVTHFGGTDEQVGLEIRYRWRPAGRGAGAQLTAGVADVQTELMRVLVGLKGTDLDFRLSVLRRVTRELAKVKQVELLTEILGQGFSAAEMPEATGHMGLEVRRAGDMAGAKALAEQARQLMVTNPSPAAQVLCEVAGVTLEAKVKLFSVPAAGQLNYYNRMYGATLNAVNNDTAAAVAVATRGTSAQADDKLRALAAVADWSDAPGDAAKAAEPVMTAEARGKSNATFQLVRLAVAAAGAGQMETADKFIAGLSDDGLRSWAKAQTIRAKLGASKEQKAELSLVEPTTEKGKIRVGQVWTALVVARHNAAATGDQSAAKEYAGWSEPAFRGCGLAGLALGIQDRKR